MLLVAPGNRQDHLTVVGLSWMKVAHVGNGLRLPCGAFGLVVLRQIGALRAGITHQLPTDQVAVAAVHRVGKHPLGGVSPERMKKALGAEFLVEVANFAVRHVADDTVLLGFAQTYKILSELRVGVAVYCRNADTVQTSRGVKTDW